MNKLNVLVLYPYYAPAYRAGGIVRSLENMAELLIEDIRFRVVCGDRDLGGALIRPSDPGRWSRINAAHVLRLAERHPWRAIARELRNIPADVFYINALFRLDYGLWPLALRSIRAIPDTPVLVATHGLFSPEAMQIRRARKIFYLRFLRHLSLLRNVSFHVTTTTERDDVLRVIPGARTLIVPSPVRPPADFEPKPESVQQTIRIIFVSRIAPKKNLLGALRTIQNTPHPVRFTIVGPVDDRKYWRECCDLIGKLGPDKEVDVKGYVPPERIREVLMANDLFLLPTYGENFCHAIYEALAAGLPVLIGHDTPWVDVADSAAGTALHPDDHQGFVEAIKQWRGSTDASRAQMKHAALARANRYVSEAHLREAHLELFWNIRRH